MSSTESKAGRVRSRKGAARRTRANHSSTSRSSTAAAATVCWARTSRGLRGGCRASMRPARMPSTVTAVSMRSRRVRGYMSPRETLPTWWPARPMRCRPEATEGGEETWMTWSTNPMSMPSSREEVATTQRRSPVLRSCSTRARCSLDTEPWWARAISRGAPVVSSPWVEPRRDSRWRGSPGGGAAPAPPTCSDQSSLSRAVSFSARPRALTKTMVERACRTCSSTEASRWGQMLATASGSRWSVPCALARLPRVEGPTARSDMSWTGTTTRMSIGEGASGATMSTGRVPPTKRATSSRGRTVAESPMRCAGHSRRASRRSRLRARWAPRLVPATAWTSSRMTVSTSRRISRAREVSMR